MRKDSAARKAERSLSTWWQSPVQASGPLGRWLSQGDMEELSPGTWKAWADGEGHAAITCVDWWPGWSWNLSSKPEHIRGRSRALCQDNGTNRDNPKHMRRDTLALEMIPRNTNAISQLIFREPYWAVFSPGKGISLYFLQGLGLGGQ